MADQNANVIRRQSEDIAGLVDGGVAGVGKLIAGQMGAVVGTAEAPLATLVFRREIEDTTYGYIKSSDVFSAVDTTAMVALTAPLKGDMCKLTSGVTYQLNSDDPSTLADWIEIGGAPVDLSSVPFIGFDGTTPASPAEGDIWYDTSDNTLCVQSDIANTVLNVGQEQLIRCVNKTGAQIPDGTVVYISGAQGNRPAIVPASYTDTDSVNKTIGVVTADIANNAEGYVCISGVVNGYNTAGFTAGDKLYLSTAGGLTNVRPSYGIVSVAYALNATANGKILVVLHRGIVKDGVIPFTGFDKPDFVTSTYSVATQKITLQGTAVLYYNGDVVFDLNAVAHASTARPSGNGLWFYKWDGSAFSWSQTPWLFSEAQLGMVYKSNTAEFGIVESHGCEPWETHRRLHETIGTSAVVMPASSGLVFNSTTAANRRPAYTSATLRDEDITVVLDATPANNFTKMHIGVGNVTVFTPASADIVELNTAVPRVNNPADGSWTDLTSNQYMNIFVIDVPTMSDTGSKVYRKWFVNGQLASSTRATIDGQLPSSVVLGDISKASQEFVFTKRILIRYASNNWTVISETDILGTKVSQITTPSLGAVALPSLVTGGLGLIPVGTTASGHTVFDGSVGPQLAFTTTGGLRVSSDVAETFTIAWPAWTAGDKVGMCYEMISGDFATKKCFAETWGEIVENTAGSEDGAFVIKAIEGGTVSEQARFVGGELQINTTTRSSVKAYIYNGLNTGLCQAVCQNNDGGALQMTKYGSVASGATIMGQSRAALSRLTGTLGALVIGTTDSNTLYFGTNNTLALTIGTDQSALFAGPIGYGVSGSANAPINVQTSGAAEQYITIRNTSTSSAAYSGFKAFSTDGTKYFSLGMTSPAGSPANTSQFYNNNPGGLAFINAAGDITFATISSANVRFRVANNGDITIGVAAQKFEVICNRGIYLTGAGAPTTAGDFAHDTTQKAFVNFANGLKGWVTREIYKMYGSVSVTNAATSTTLFGGTAVGTNSLPANAFLAGKTYIVKCGGVYARTAVDQFVIGLYYNVSGTFNEISPSAWVSDSSDLEGTWSVESTFICVSSTTCRSTFVLFNTLGGSNTSVWNSVSNGTLNQTISASAGTLTVACSGVASTTTVTCAYATITEC